MAIQHPLAVTLLTRLSHSPYPCRSAGGGYKFLSSTAPEEAIKGILLELDLEIVAAIDVSSAEQVTVHLKELAALGTELAT